MAVKEHALTRSLAFARASAGRKLALDVNKALELLNLLPKIDKLGFHLGTIYTFEQIRSGLLGEGEREGMPALTFDTLAVSLEGIIEEPEIVFSAPKAATPRELEACKAKDVEVVDAILTKLRAALEPVAKEYRLSEESLSIIQAAIEVRFAIGLNEKGIITPDVARKVAAGEHDDGECVLRVLYKEAGVELGESERTFIEHLVLIRAAVCQLTLEVNGTDISNYCSKEPKESSVSAAAISSSEDARKIKALKLEVKQELVDVLHFLTTKLPFHKSDDVLKFAAGFINHTMKTTEKVHLSRDEIWGFALESLSEVMGEDSTYEAKLSEHLGRLLPCPTRTLSVSEESCGSHSGRSSVPAGGGGSGGGKFSSPTLGS